MGSGGETMDSAMGIATRILYEDNHLLAVNKQVGELVQGDRTGDTCLLDTLKAFIAQRDHKPGNVFLSPIHRIDRPVSGVVLFAKTSKGLARMNALFRQRAVSRHYWAVLEAQLPELSGLLTGYATRNGRINKTFISPTASAEAKPVELGYTLVGASSRYFLYDITLHTGRHHQIRAQVAAARAPVRGDLKYGAARSLPSGGIDLHARAVSFEHPVTHAPVAIVAPPPEGKLWQLFVDLARQQEASQGLPGAKATK